MGLTAAHRSRSLFLGLLGLAYLGVIPLLFRDSPYLLGVITTASVPSLISLGVWVTFASGRINISQGAYALIGGYTTAILSTRYGPACRCRAWRRRPWGR